MVKNFLSLIKFSHTIFAMPFALVGYVLGVQRTGFDFSLLIYVVLCMVLARSAAMGFNRIVDRHYDALNPRTASREIPSGQISSTATAWLVALCCCAFVVVALMINVACFLLSPIALAVILGYSYTKRFTSWCHLVLGFALAIAPIGAYIAVTGEVSALILLVGLLVLSWVAGFDVIFALQDVDFDRSAGLYSIPAKLGIPRALRLSAALHGLSIAIVIAIGAFITDGAYFWLYGVGAGLFCGLLIFQHLIVKPNDLSRVNLAFGTTNGVASVVYAAFTIAAVLL